MRIKSFEYKWVSLSTESLTNWVILEDIEFSISSRTQIYNNELFHWWNATKTLWNLRLFTISWKIVWTNATLREQAMRTLQTITLIWSWQEYFVFNFEDFTWWLYRTNCKVYDVIKFDTSNKWEPVIDFTFELLADKVEFLSFQKTLINTVYDPNLYVSWWTELGVELWHELGNSSWIVVNNLGNFDATCRIEIIGAVSDPKITNQTNLRSYWLNASTTNLILDNTWTKYIVTDVWVDISWARTSWSLSIVLSPWVNVLTLNAWSDTTWLIFKIYFSNTYL